MVQLLNLHSGQFEDALLVSPIEQADIDCYSAQWRPVLDAKVMELRSLDRYTIEDLGKFQVQDASWEWAQKYVDRAGQLEWNSVAIRCDGRTQGLMYLNLLRRCRIEAQAHQHLVYVDLLATAPWNRRALVDRPHYEGVGHVLMTEAILLSIAEDFAGRVGLHALPQSSKFYETKCGMECLGIERSGLVYFELTPEGATRFLES
jgi:hypothetical protein